jgi:hypothetical protein
LNTRAWPARARATKADGALFAHGHVLRVLKAAEYQRRDRRSQRNLRHAGKSFFCR